MVRVIRQTAQRPSRRMADDDGLTRPADVLGLRVIALTASRAGTLTCETCGYKKTAALRGRAVAGGGGYLAAISATVVSSILFEKPHSLSYQLETLTSRPLTLVSVASNTLDSGLWLKSTETSGSVL